MVLRLFLSLFIFQTLFCDAQPSKIALPNKTYWHSFYDDSKTIANHIIKPTPNTVLLGIAMGVAGTGLLYHDLEIKSWANKNQKQSLSKASKVIEPMGRGSTAVGLVGGYYLLGIITGNIKTQQQAMIAAKSLFFTSGVIVGGLKYTTQRQRPYTTNNPLSFHGIWNTTKYHSFPSGHTADAFCLATFFTHQFRSKWLAIPLYAGATAVGLSRIYDNQHWASDVFFGALISTLATHAILTANKNGFNNTKSKQNKAAQF
jgi:membrane-associated phospholipid phosphatase